MNDTELLKELLGHFYVTYDGNLDWAYTDDAGGLRGVVENPKVIEALVKRRSELYGEKVVMLSYEEREKYACDVCGNVPDEDGIIEHGRGCYTQSEDGGGYSTVEFTPQETAVESQANAQQAQP